jgi:hypothetical protein
MIIISALLISPLLIAATSEIQTPIELRFFQHDSLPRSQPLRALNPLPHSQPSPALSNCLGAFTPFPYCFSSTVVQVAIARTGQCPLPYKHAFPRPKHRGGSFRFRPEPIHGPLLLLESCFRGNKCGKGRVGHDS